MRTTQPGRRPTSSGPTSNSPGSLGGGSAGERGAAVVEMAVVVSLLMTILLGIVSFGMTHHQNISIEGAAREASRFAATYPVADAGSMEQWLRDVAGVAEAAATGTLSPTADSRLVCVAQGSGADSSGFSRIRVTGSQPTATASEEANWCFENTAPGTDTVVQVQLQREGWIEGILFSMRPTLTGEATSRFERVEP
jgi:Flp pilus assembly protein TadG